MKKIIVFLSLLLSSMISLSAQDTCQKEVNSDFRSRGYKGSVLYTNHYFVWQGIETSHGYMFNRHHYLGAGVGAFFLPLDNVPAFGRVFAEYNAYIKEKGSTPTAGVKLGFCHALNYNNDCKFVSLRRCPSLNPETSGLPSRKTFFSYDDTRRSCGGYNLLQEERHLL